MSFAPTHHPAEETLLRHAAGSLPFGHSLVIALHLPFCPECQATVRLGESVGGALLSDQPPADLTPDLLTRTLVRLETPACRAEFTEDHLELAEGVPVPAALRGLVRPKWRWLAPGISRIALNIPDASRDNVYLLRVGPGKSLPDHGHHGWEATCVLAGSFTDTTGEYAAGDVAETDVSVMHQPMAGADEACICLVAWEGKLRMRGMFARLVQPLLGV